jgi:8-oxo-dGTP pyrophosphatase MutT (NUDIX family)
MGKTTTTANVTWDGLPVSDEPPFGAAVVVWRRTVSGDLETLMLHRAHHGPDFAGDWAWTPPTGCRFPGEPIRECAERELYEEAGLRLPIDFINYGNENWHMYTAEATLTDTVTLIDKEHDRYEWLPVAMALKRCAPADVGDPLRRALHALA